MDVRDVEAIRTSREESLLVGDPIVYPYNYEPEGWRYWVWRWFSGGPARCKAFEDAAIAARREVQQFKNDDARIQVQKELLQQTYARRESDARLYKFMCEYFPEEQRMAIQQNRPLSDLAIELLMRFKQAGR